MSVLQTATGTKGESPPALTGVEASVRAYGEKLFTLMDAAEPPSLFSAKGLYATLMDWAMRDEQFKTQLFRFVDVLPTLTSSAAISRHLKEYLDSDEVKLPATLRLALKASSGMSWLFGGGMKAQVTAMARQFMLGSDEQEIVATLRSLHEQDIAFTVDILGEAVVSEVEADKYAARYLRLVELLANEAVQWPHRCQSNLSSRGPLPRLNISIKLSALYSQIHPDDPDTAVEKIRERLRPILRRAKETGAFINLDMEHYALKNLTLRAFRSVFAEEEFSREPACGLALQVYLKDCERDLRDLIDWARKSGRRIMVRLVKGAYWDFETVIAQQRRWPVPVFGHKAETDANFEKLSVLLLENEEAVEAAFGTHNVRSMAHALAQADRLGVDHRAFEFQMLYGMADPIKAALLQMGCRVREYCPVGELLPGMAYLVRRLLENTSNEGFLANKFARGASREELLKNPKEVLPAGNAWVGTARRAVRERSPRRGDPTSAQGGQHLTPAFSSSEGETESAALHGERSPGVQVPIQQSVGSLSPRDAGGAGSFTNEPHTDFTIDAEREEFRKAIQETRRNLGRKCPLIINNRPVQTRDWLPSLNPANQEEVIGYAARAGIEEAEAALEAAKEAQPKWAGRPTDERAALLERVAELMRRDRAALAALEILEAGKNWPEADADVAEAIDFCNFYAAMMRELGKSQRTQPVAGETNFQHWWPRRVAVVIAPWNFPLAILTGMTSAAVVTGNAVLMKPSDQTPVIGARLMELFMEAGAPPGVLNLITGPGSTVAAHLVAHPHVDLVAFTGSKEVGLKLWEAAGRTSPGQANLKKVICEMGGKNAVIVDSDADLDEAVAGVVASAFGYQGQKCSALSRLIVLAENYERFMERLIAATASLRVGPAEEPGNIIGPVISREAQQRILDAIKAGRNEAKLLWQGKVPDTPSACYVPPTIFADVPPASRLFREEIFGPVLSVTEAGNFDEALVLANDSAFALTGGLYSRSPVNIERAKAEMVCGNLYINRPITGAIVERQPFGGFKMSGGGTKAGGREYLRQFMVPRVVTENCLRRGFAPAEEEETSACGD